MTTDAAPRVTLYSRPGCHLCDDARAVIAEVAVIGVTDEQTGEAVVAYVRSTGGDPAALAEAVREHCSARLARFKQPSRIEIVGELPRTVTGKVQKGRLRGIERRRALGLLE